VAELEGWRSPADMVNTMGGNYLIENRDDRVFPACNFLELWRVHDMILRSQVPTYVKHTQVY